MGINTAPEQPVAVPGEERNFAVSFVDVLDSGELLTGTPAVVELVSSDLTIENKVVNSSTQVINDVSVAAGLAVQFSAKDFVEATVAYRVQITVSTDSTPAQVLIKYATFGVATT
jgi:hypothetical protein